MPNRDIRLTHDVQVSLVPDQYTTTGNGTGVDVSACDAALVTVPTGTFGGTTPTASFKVQESVDNSTFTDVADTDLIGVTGNTSGVALAASAVQKVSYVGTQRYIRVAISAVAGGSAVIRVGADVIRAKLAYTPGQPV